jgi:hypothetical protein
VANGLKLNCPKDERKHVFELPNFITKMQEKKLEHMLFVLTKKLLKKLIIKK